MSWSKELQMDEIRLLTKNLSYEGGYHRRVFYPKLVYDRVLQRYAFVSSRSSSGSFSLSRSSSSSLPDLVEALLQDAEKNLSSELTGLLPRKQSSSNDNLLYNAPDNSCRHVPFDIGESHDDGSSAEPISDLDGSAASSECLAAPIGSTTGNSKQVELMNELELIEMVRPLRRRRSSSLRRSRSRSPGQSSESLSNKAVRFADTMGFHLRSVRLFANKDKPPILPASALSDLRKGLEEAHKDEGTRYVCACFKQPVDTSDFLERVRLKGVCLERCVVGECDRTVTGTVRVANLSFKKLVYIRYTVNRWVTFNDISASYVLGSNDGDTDQFVFAINLPKNISVGSRLEFAIRYDAVDIGRTFWDNNLTVNYSFECFARSVPTRESDFAWLHFL